MYFEHHVLVKHDLCFFVDVSQVKEMFMPWGIGMQQTLVDSYRIFLQLRVFGAIYLDIFCSFGCLVPFRVFGAIYLPFACKLFSL